MQCMKCGQEVENTGVFCAECVAQMEKYPVRPGTVVQLPKYHSEAPVRKQPKRKAPPTLEEQVQILRKWTRILAAALAVSILLFLGSGILAFWLLREQEPQLLPGQNYSAATTAETDEQTQ